MITVRGKELLERADLIIYAGSLVNPALLHYAKRTCRVVNSASLTLEDVIAFMEEAEAKGLMTVRLHTGDPSIYGAIREQMDILKEKIYPIHAFLALALFVRLQQPYRQNTRCRVSASPSSLRAWKAVHLFPIHNT